MLKILRFVLLCLGVALAAYLFWKHSGQISQALRDVGWGFAVYMAASFAIYALDTWGWRFAFMAGQPHVGFGHLFSVRMAGEAANKVTPLASMGGEPLKAYLLTRHGSSGLDAAASVAIAKNTMTLAQIAFIFVGVVLGFGLLPGRAEVLLGFAVFPGMIFSAIAVTAVVDLKLRRQRRREGEEATETGKSRFRVVVEMWSRVADFFWARPIPFLLSFLCFFVGWAAGTLELLAGAWAMGYPLDVRSALVLEALLVSINMATFFIPANAGSQEGGFVYLSAMFGLAGPLGVTLAVLRRCRDVIWVLYGLGYLAVTEGRILFRPAPVDRSQEVSPSRS